MGCNCGGAAKKPVKYAIQGDPANKRYLSEKEAKDAARERGLAGAVVPIAG